MALSKGDGFTTASTWIKNFGYNAGGWRVGKNPRIMADVSGDGHADVVGFANDGVNVALAK